MEKLTERARVEWDKRIESDYRYWMSDGVQNDEVMWETGSRDFQLLTSELTSERLTNQTILEVGCGVGRLMREAAKRSNRVIGLDISPKALAEARRLLGDVPSVELLLGDGSNIPLESSSCDMAYSFAALGSMPAKVMIRYLAELTRVVKHGGNVCLQIYLGKYNGVFEEDTLTLRSYQQDKYVELLNYLGFELRSLKRLELPFQVSWDEEGIIAYLVTLEVSRGVNQLDLDYALKLLGAEEEPVAGETWQGSYTDYLMWLSRAEQLITVGDYGAACQSLEGAMNAVATVDENFFLLVGVLERFHPQAKVLFNTAYDKACGQAQGLDKGIAKGMTQESSEINLGAASVTSSSGKQAKCDLFNSEMWDEATFVRNLHAIPACSKQVGTTLPSSIGAKDVSIARAANGSPVVVYREMPLDQTAQPEKAAQAWADRVLGERRVRDADALIILGFATGYHIMHLLKECNTPLYVLEPHPEVLAAAFGTQDLSAVLGKLACLAVSVEQLSPHLVGKERVEIIVHPQTGAVAGSVVDEVRSKFTGEKGLRELSPSFAVVGPLYGGTLPMAEYVARGIAQMGQRVNLYNFSGMNSSYQEIKKFVSKQSHIDRNENAYAEWLSQILLDSLAERPVDILICLAQAPVTPRALTELRKRGIITVMWFVEDCGRFKAWKQLAPYYDYFFVIQKDRYPEEIIKAGAAHVHYLPVACDPTVHRPVAVTPEERARFGAELSFVGAGYNNRTKMFVRLACRDFRIWGTEWPEARPFDTLVQEKGRRIAPEDYVKIFSSSDINLNLHSSSERDGVEPKGDFVNPRALELAASGAFQLVDRRSLLPELLTEGVEVACFSDAQELEEKIDYYLEHPEERLRMANNAQERALREHTYQHRLRQMLQYIYADNYTELKSRLNQGTWPVLLEASKKYPELETRCHAAFRAGRMPTVDSLAADIHVGKGELTDDEMRILFMYHVRQFTSYVKELNDGKTT